MHVSLSEIQTTVCKAAVAVGLPLGLGEDAGWAARRMMAIGVGSFAAFVDAIDTVDDGRSTGFDADRAIAGSFGPQPAGLLLSAIRAGPSVCDLVALATGTDIEFAPLTLTDVDIPSVILFEVLAATADRDRGLCVAWNAGGGSEIDAVCWRGTLVLIKGAPEDLHATDSAEITIRLVMQEPLEQGFTVDQRIQREAVEIDDATWRRITTYADRLLVVASETSRLTGAGAGDVIDTD